jgi:hypothetical protein
MSRLTRKLQDWPMLEAAIDHKIEEQAEFCEVSKWRKRLADRMGYRAAIGNNLGVLLRPRSMRESGAPGMTSHHIRNSLSIQLARRRGDSDG